MIELAIQSVVVSVQRMVNPTISGVVGFIIKFSSI